MGHNFRILIVEDDQAIAEAMQMILTSEGYRTLWADNIHSAFRLFKAEPPNLILLDYLLPNGNGDIFVKEIRKTSSVPIFLVTAATNADAIAETLKITKVIKKPFNLEDLLNNVKELSSSTS